MIFVGEYICDMNNLCYNKGLVSFNCIGFCMKVIYEYEADEMYVCKLFFFSSERTWDLVFDSRIFCLSPPIVFIVLLTWHIMIRQSVAEMKNTRKPWVEMN